MEDLIEDPVKEERERRRRAIEKWTKESNDKFSAGLATQGKRIRKLANPLPDITVADCVEHYYMAKPFHFDFEEWRAQEEIKEKRSLALSREKQETGLSPETEQSCDSTKPQTCASNNKDQRVQDGSDASLETKEKVEPKATEEAVVIEMNDEPDGVFALQ
ncbi:nuclear receptor corepressor 2-like [Montipora capricornis]|uniref:nuclear receptor corepressor 2-like n=1 Tax=Montipora foliosa TaxID=591990 RepID=UPI0035F1E0E1